MDEPDGEVSGLISEVDVTERYKARQDLQDSRAEFEGLFQTAPDAMLLVGVDGTITRANRQAQDVFGYDQEDLVGQLVEILMPERFSEKHIFYRDAFSRQPGVRPMRRGLALFGLHKNGKEFPVDIASGPLKVGKAIRVICAIRPL